MKAFLVARVSTDDQKDALPAQVSRLLEYVKRLGYEYELIEILESAYKENRNEFQIVVEKLQAYHEKAIVVFDKIDRYSRDSSSEPVRALNKLIIANKIEIHFPSDNLIIHKDSPASDKVRLNIGLVFSQYYSDAISDNVKRRLEQKLRDGEWIGQAPTGYLNSTKSNGNKWVDIDPFKATMVIKMFKEYATGNTSLRSLSILCRDEFGIKSSISSIDKILKNPFYYGQMKVKDVLYPHKYETLISKSLFDQANAVRNGYKISQHRWAGLPFAFRGLIKCADCGCRVTFEIKKGKYIYGHCTQYKGRHNAQYVSEDVLSSEISNVFKKIQIPEEAFVTVSEALKASHEDNNNQKETKIATLNIEILKYQSRLEKIYEDYLDEVIPKSLYEKKSVEYKTKQQALVDRRENIELIENDNYGTLLHLLGLARDLPKLFLNGNNEEKRSIINLVLSNLQLDGKQLRWELKKPYDTMVFCNENSTWQGHEESNFDRRFWRPVY